MKYLEENEHKCFDSLDFSPKQLFWIAYSQDWCIANRFDYASSFQTYEVNTKQLRVANFSLFLFIFIVVDNIYFLCRSMFRDLDPMLLDHGEPTLC